MKISEILEGRIPKKYWMPEAQTPGAPSLDDGPEDEEDELDDSEEEEDDAKNKLIEKFKTHAGNVGDNLYAVSAWDYYGDVLSPEDEPATSNGTLKNILSDSGIDELTKEDRDSYLENGRIDAAILDSNTGNIVVFVADPGSEGSHISKGYQEAFEPGQAAKLNKIADVGKKYVKYASACIDSGYRKHFHETIKLRNQLLKLLGFGDGYKAPDDRSPEEKEKEERYLSRLKAMGIKV
jgi:hypothetical protein